MEFLKELLGKIVASIGAIFLVVLYGKKLQQNEDNANELDAIRQDKKDDAKVDQLTDAEQLEYARTGVFPSRELL